MKLYLQRGWDSELEFLFEGDYEDCQKKIYEVSNGNPYTRNWRETVSGKEYVKVDYGSWNTFILMDLETESGNEI